MMNGYRTAKVRMRLEDSKTGDPVGYAAVYLCPPGDSTIRAFTLSDEKGVAVLEDVIQGRYRLNVEMVGYRSVSKDVSIRLEIFADEVKLGKIAMEEDHEYLKAATVTAGGNAVVVRKDTITYNANAYRTAENGMLADLLKKMPGIKLGADGSVMVNGEVVNKITVGGKTFFQKDPALTVKSLPAKIVDKVQIIEKAKEDAEFSGVGTMDDRERVMDLVLKEEYGKGWFGNAKLSGGAAINSKRDDVSKNKFLFNGNAVASYYDSADQVVLLAGGKNADEPGSWSMDEDMNFDMGGSEEDEMSGKSGLRTDSQVGINYNTERIPGMETSVSASYNYLKKDVRESTSRTSFQEDGENIVTKGLCLGTASDHSASVFGELKNSDTDRYLLVFRPYFHYAARNRNVSNEYDTRTGDQADNTGRSAKLSHGDVFSGFAELEAGIRNLGKERRSITLKGDFGFDRNLSNSMENSTLKYADKEESRLLNYLNNSWSVYPRLELSYVEPFGANWSMQTRISTSFSDSDNSRNAFNGADGSVNESYTTFSRNEDLNIRQRILVQYKKNDCSVLFGLQLDEEQNVTTARNYGKEDMVGKGKWLLNWAPYIDFTRKSDNNTFRFEYKGSSTTPSGLRIIPAADVSNPVSITTGNIYLRPQFDHSAVTILRHSNPRSYSFVELFATASLSLSPIVDANWFDQEGVRYSLPVNSRKPAGDLELYGSWNQSFGKEKDFTFSLDCEFSYSHSKGYQATGRMAAIDKDGFDYHGFMALLWGGITGDRFYSGESGFRQSNTNTFISSIYPMLAYKKDRFSATLMGFVTNNTNRYSLDRTADMSTWDFNVSAELLYNTPKQWLFNTDLGYSFYKGYSYGFGKPELIWNAGIAKEIKSFTLSFKIADILGQQRSLHRTSSAEYVEDVSRKVLGRYFLIGLSYNFGRMNAAQSRNIRNAIRDISEF